MHITHLYLNGVGPLTQSHLDLQDEWRGGAHSQVLLTGPNGCGKSTLLRAIAMPCRYSVNSFATTGLHDRFSPLESVAVTMRPINAMTSKTTGFGGAVSGMRAV